MKYVDEFRDRRLIGKVASRIRKEADSAKIYSFMEVCGTHTMNIFRFGLRDLLPENIRLVSGPGCPVCVTPNSFIDKAVWLAKKGLVVATFGDMMRVPGSRSSLEKESSRGCAVRTVYSTLDALELARRNPDKEIVFLGIGFETTAPTVASSILSAQKSGIANYSVLCGHKTMPEALRLLARDREIRVDGFLLPGHVSAITGSGPYEFLAKRFNKRCVIAGFEPLDILEAILMLIRQKKPAVEIQYTRIINREGNLLARRVISRVFDATSSIWRGIGKIKNSGLKIKRGFSNFDAETRFRPKAGVSMENEDCICGEVLKGTKRPVDCKLFGRVCNDGNPVGACMVSSEGTCAAYYRYRGI